jgi:Rrf2 family transcriptional regulator, iron-sulfur cluster assembly transcription factor
MAHSEVKAMRLTRAGEYAIRCMLYLSCLGVDKIGSRMEIAQAMDIPAQFLGKIAQQLARAGYIEIAQGPKGGFRLALPPEKITLLGVIEAVIGEIYLNDCLMRPESCHRSPTCTVYLVWEKARNQLRQTLEETTFATLQSEPSCFDLIGKSPNEKK